MYDHHPFYICTDEDRELIRSELGLKKSTIDEGVDAIMDWFVKQPHLVEAGIDRAIIENMIIIAKGSLEKTKRRIDNFYKYRNIAPELIQNRDKVLSNSEDLWSSYVQLAMPKLYKGNRVGVFKLTEKDSSKFSAEIVFRNTFMALRYFACKYRLKLPERCPAELDFWCDLFVMGHIQYNYVKKKLFYERFHYNNLADLRLKYDCFLSDIWVVDFKNGSFSHLLKLNPLIMQKTAQIFHEGLGTRVLAIHILSATTLLQQVVSFMRQFFSPKVMDRIILHDSVESLHKYIPKQYLPKDYGGEEPYLAEYKDKYEKEMRSTRTKNILIEMSKMVSNESRRPNAGKNEEFLVGTFRKLDLD